MMKMCLQSRNICAHLETDLVISRAVFGDHKIFCGDCRRQRFYDKLDGATCKKKSTNHKLSCITLTLVDPLG